MCARFRQSLCEVEEVSAILQLPFFVLDDSEDLDHSSFALCAQTVRGVASLEKSPMLVLGCL